MLIAQDATAETVTHTGLVHKVYIPDPTPGAKPAVILVHGRAGDSGVMWVFSQAVQRLHPIVLAVEAPYRDPRGGFSWWAVGETHEENKDKTASAELETSLKLLADFIKRISGVYPIDPAQVYGIGFSQGAAMLAALSLRSPKLLCGVAMLAGFIPAAVLSEVSAGSPILPITKYFISHGSKDTKVPLARAEEARSALERLGCVVRFHTEDVGHKVGTSGMKALKLWFEELHETGSA